MLRTLSIIALGGLGYYAFRKGMFDGLGLGGETKKSASQFLSEIETLTLGPPTGPAPAPIQLHPKELFVRRNHLHWSRFVAPNIVWTAAIAMTEWRHDSPPPRGSAGEVGYMQVKPSTAEEMFDRGYTRMQPTTDVLQTEEGSIYFGTAYLEYLSETFKRGREWTTMAYNGGPGWESKSAAYQDARRKYLERVQIHAAIIDAARG